MICGLMEAISDATAPPIHAEETVLMPLWRGDYSEIAHRRPSAKPPAWEGAQVEPFCVNIGVPVGLPRFLAKSEGPKFNAKFVCRNLSFSLSTLSCAVAAVPVGVSLNTCFPSFRMGMVKLSVHGELEGDSLAHFARCTSACSLAIETFFCLEIVLVGIVPSSELLICSVAHDDYSSLWGLLSDSVYTTLFVAQLAFPHPAGQIVDARLSIHAHRHWPCLLL